MKTIAISIDEPTLAALDRLAGKRRERRNRSELVRQALAEFLAKRERLEMEARDRGTLARHRARLARQARALIAEQARP
jgi:metal-responsive CopG/Arc/MetJ family transcriptional regulator